MKPNFTRNVLRRAGIAALCLFCWLSAAAQSERLVHGEVTGEDRVPLPGVNILIKGTTTGTTTDVEGRFELRVADPNAVLVFSFIGYLSQEIQPGSQTSLSITLKQDLKTLEEVVVVGYGTQKKSDLTGSVASISPKQFENQPVTTLAEMLQGRVPGVAVTNSNGGPGGGTKIRIRGTNSIRGDNDPLIIVDGFPGGIIPLNGVKSIEVLKDASATAIYGSRGANGVIIITTERGSSQTPKLTLTSNVGFSRVAKKYDLLNGPEYYQFLEKFTGQTGLYSQEDIDWFTSTGGTDWQDALLGQGINQNYQASLSGQSGKIRYFLSGQYLDEKGILLNTSANTYSFRSNITSDVSDRLTIGFDLSALESLTENQGTASGTGKTNPIWNALTWSPTEPIYNPDGTYNRSDPFGSIEFNPYMAQNERVDDGRSQQMALNTNLKYRILEGLDFSTIAGMRRTNGQDAQFSNEHIASSPSASRNQRTGLSWQITSLLSYTRKFWDQHTLTLLGGHEQYLTQSTGVNATSRNISITSVGYDNLGLGSTQTITSSYSKSTLRSYFGRLNYNFSSKYFLTATYRADGSSKFRDENKYGFFPSVAAAWDVSKEDFLSGTGIFHQLKIRGSWGVTGSQAVGAYATLSPLKTTTYTYATSTKYPGYAPGVASNVDLRWEETEQTNIGIDASFWQGKISVTLDYFDKTTTGLLSSRQLPNYNGGGNVLANLGSMENKGFEASVNAIVAQGRDFTWDAGFNTSVVRNKVLDLGESTQLPGGGTISGLMPTSPFMTLPGEPLATFWGARFLGLWQTSEAEEALKYGNIPGDSKYEDLDGNYKINAQDYQIIGNANPKFTWGFSNSFNYKNWGLNVLVEGVHGRDVFNAAYATMTSVFGDSRSITLREATNIWTPENQNTIWPANSSSNINLMNSSKWLQDGSFVKIRNISLFYNLSREITKIADMKLTVSAQNFFTFTKYKGIDPEVTGTGSSDTAGGLDFGTYPVPKVITVGASITF